MAKFLNQKGKAFPKLLDQLEVLRKGKIAAGDVVSLSEYREAKKNQYAGVVLVVDNDEAVREGMKRILVANNFLVVLAEDGMELARVLENRKVDIVFLGADLPWVDGYDLCLLLKSNRLYQSLPIVMLSSSSGQNDVKRAFDSGCTDYLVKPFDIQGLLDAVERCLGRLSG